MISAIKRLFGFQARSAATTQQKAVTPEVEKELEVKGDEFRPGFDYSYESRAFGTPVLKLEAGSLQEVWSSEAQAGPRKKLLDRVFSKVRNETIRDREIEELKGLDQSREDFDSRVGHIVLPSEEFEFHADSGLVRYPKTPMPDVIRNDDTYSLSNQNGTLTVNTSERLARFEPAAAKRVEGPDHSAHTTVKVREDFAIDADGKVVIPSANSLEEAEDIASRRESALQAQGVLQAAGFLRGKIAEWDNSPFDSNLSPGQTLIPNQEEFYQRRELEYGLSVRGADFDHAASFALEGDSRSFSCYLHTRRSRREGTPVHLLLKGTDEGSLVRVSQFFPHLDEVRSVEWNKESGLVRYKALSRSEATS